MKNIVTTCVAPPIPTRQFDWCAHYEGDEERGHYGYGPTEQDAISDFIENYSDRDEPRRRWLIKSEAQS